jgi:hypothetical protein
MSAKDTKCSDRFYIDLNINTNNETAAKIVIIQMSLQSMTIATIS